MARLLNQTAIGRDEDFYSLGGNWVAALQLVFELEGQFGISLPTTIVHQETTVARLAALLNPATRSDYHDPRGGTWRIGHHRIVTTDASDDRLPETIEHQIRKRISNSAGDRPSAARIRCCAASTPPVAASRCSGAYRASASSCGWPNSSATSNRSMPCDPGCS